MALVEQGCFYCEPNEKRESLMTEIGTIGMGRVFLFKDQAHKGRAVVAYADHKTELFQMTDEELASFMGTVAKVAGAVKKLWGCDKINYAAYGDGVQHMHFHIVPKFKDGLAWGGAFDISNPNPVYPSADEFASMMDSLKAELGL